MYPLHTELERKEPLGSKDEPDPFDKIKILAFSPTKQASREEWEGGNSDHFVVTPLIEFGSNEVISGDYLQANYDVIKYGDEEGPKKIDLDMRRESLRQKPTPEQIFAKAARNSTSKRKEGKINESA